MTHIADDSSELYEDPEDGHVYRSIGWLGSRVPTVGSMDPRVLERLRILKITNSVDDFSLGVHCCEVCGKHTDHGQFFAQGDGVRYLMPSMVDHYVSAHRYRLPDAVVSAVVEAVLPDRLDHLRERVAAERMGWTIIEITAERAVVRRVRDEAGPIEDLGFVLARRPTSIVDD